MKEIYIKYFNNNIYNAYVYIKIYIKIIIN